MNKFQYAGIAAIALVLDVLIHVNSVARNIDTGTVATVGQIAIAVAASALALAGITGQANAQSAKLDIISDQTNGHLQSNIAKAIQESLPPVVHEAVAAIVPVPIPVPTVVMGTPVPAAGLPPTPPAMPLTTEGKPR